MVLPVAGAVLGGAVGGPVGIVAGLKAAKLAAFSGGILGTFFTEPTDLLILV